MKVIQLGLIILCISMISQSCSTPKTYSQSSFIDDGNCTFNTSTFLFFKEDKIPFPYKIKAIVKVKRNHQISYNEALNSLKQQAKQNCANALIHIKPKQEYLKQWYFQALAVKMSPNQQFIKQYETGKYIATPYTRKKHRKRQKSKVTLDEVIDVIDGVTGFIEGVNMIFGNGQDTTEDCDQ